MIELSKDKKGILIGKIKQYFNKELNQEIGGLEAECLLDFFLKELGSNVYNQALADTHQLLEQQFENMADEIYNLEKPTSDT